MIGVISHLPNPTFADVRALGRAAEAAGAEWLGLPDAFWWRDTWLLLAEAAKATERIAIGPLVTNPYLRHPFHTLAALASLQEIAPDRVFIGLGAGGSEVTGAANIPRHDAPQRVEALARSLRDVARGEPLDPRSGRRLEVPLKQAPILIAGRADGMLRAAGRSADRALLWAIPRSELERSRAIVVDAAQHRPTPPDLVWAPLVDHGGHSRERVRAIAAYSVLNSRPAAQARWGLNPQSISTLRALLVGGGAAEARDLVPAAALDDLIVADADPTNVGRMAARLNATSLAIPAFSTHEVEERVAWARAVLAAASHETSVPAPS